LDDGLVIVRIGRRPVATCNLKADESGDVRPGAKAVDAKAALAIPVVGTDGDVRAVVGIAFAAEREFDEAALAAFERAASALPPVTAPGAAG
ncbi:MAG: GAF domain-containing protein, partial [Pseudomonadota bacterium]